MAYQVVHAPWTPCRERLRAIREAVFIVEQNVAQSIEWDGYDEAATHFLAIADGGQDIGCARLLPSGQIGRMAVLPAWRGAGAGMSLLLEAIGESQRLGHKRCFLQAQEHAVGFYANAGFVICGEPFQEADIPHVEMELLALPDFNS